MNSPDRSQPVPDQGFESGIRGSAAAAAEALIQACYGLDRSDAHKVLTRWADGLGVTTQSLPLMLAALPGGGYRLSEPYAHLPVACDLLSPLESSTLGRTDERESGPPSP
jgi:hypothetical protein